MSDLRYRITGGLSRENIATMHDRALSLIEEVGLGVRHAGVRRRLAEYDGVRIDGEQVRFAPELVERTRAQLRYPDWLTDGQVRVISGAYELNVLDLETGDIRPATLADLRDLTKLQDSYGMYGSAPVRPTDLPRPLQEVAQYKVCWENSRYISGSVFEANEKSSRAVAEIIYEMAQAAGKPFSLGFWIASPFKTTETELDIMLHFLDRQVPLWVATMPIAGATAPIFLPGAYVQSIAELLAGLTLLHLLNPAVPVSALIIDSIRAYPFDMKFGSFVYGSPEDLLATLFQVQLNEFYGIPVVAKSLLTTAQLPDAHAAAEKAAHTVAAALAGARIFTNAGLLSVDEIFSAEQLIIDHEIVEYAKQLLKPIPFDEEALAVEAIREVGIGGHFLGHDTTLAHWREAFWGPELFEHRMLAPWREAGSQSLRARARAIAQRRIAEHEYELPADVQRELDRIYHFAEETLAG